MKYKILDIQTLADTVTTSVEITFDCGVKKTVSIPHFRPQSKEEVLLSIENRVISEEASHVAETKNKQLVSAMSDTVETIIELRKG